MAEQGGQEKTEAPTPKKREDARKEGQVASSREVASAALLGTFVIYFGIAGTSMLQQMEVFWRTALSNLLMPDLDLQTVQGGWQGTLWLMALTIGMLMAAVFFVALAVGAMQAGLHFNGIKVQASRLNPLAGMKRIFSHQGLSELFKGLFKMGVIGYITYVTISAQIIDLVSLARMPLQSIFAYNFELLATIFARVVLALLVLAVFDYMYQRWSMEQRIKMTKQEVREEMKQTEGDPQLRSRVRQIQREMSRARMMEKVPQSDVVVTNPTHFAVALEYDREVMVAPRVVAKGADHLAERIKAVALENAVPIVENPLVAREVYARVEIGDEVPEEFFRAVAEILAYVYRLKGKVVAPVDGAPSAGTAPSGRFGSDSTTLGTSTRV